MENVGDFIDIHRGSQAGEASEIHETHAIFFAKGSVKKLQGVHEQTEKM